MKKDKDSNDELVDDVVFEPEQSETKSSFNMQNEDSQLKKLKKKLKESEAKAKENLDGWQRLKADIANSKQNDNVRLDKAKQKGVEDVLESLLPVLDSFDSAMHGDSWNNIDKAWRQGMEFVYSQMTGALESHGVSPFGIVGDMFDTTAYEAAEHKIVTEQDQDGIVQKVLRKGYKNGSNIIRPARVVVGKFEK